MRFGLYGINGLYNFGCEAIVRGTYRFLKDCRKDAEIFYFTYNYEYDSQILADMDIKLVNVKRNKNIVNRIINKTLSIASIDKRILPFDWKRIIDQVDVIVSIGGDMYTIPEAVRKGSEYPYYNSLADFCNRAIDHGKQVIVYGASMGPWGSYKCAVDYYVRNISRYQYLVCREYVTIDYLNSVGIKSARFQPDPAFLVKLPERAEVSSKKRFIGINLSPLALRELYGSYSEEMVGRFAELIKQVIEQFSSDILLIPHVLSDDESDNDEKMLRKLRASLPEQYRKKTELADTDRGFLGIKEQLHKCKFIVSARMHCAINAITEGVPAIFLSYSQKSQGMAQYVYGSKKWMLSIKKVDVELIPLMVEMDGCWEKTADCLEKRIDEIRQDYSRLQMEQQLFN